MPLGAVVTTPEIASVMAQKIQFNTYGGNPVCSAGGLAVLKVIDNEKRQAHCADVGSHLLERLRSLQQRHDSMSFFIITPSEWLIFQYCFYDMFAILSYLCKCLIIIYCDSHW